MKDFKKKDILKLIIRIFVSIVFSLLLGRMYFVDENIVLNVIAYILTGLLVYLILDFCDKKEINNNKVISYIFGFIFSFALIVGKSINDTNSISSLIEPLNELFLTIVSILIFTYVVGKGFAALIYVVENKKLKNSDIVFKRKHFLIIWLIIFISFIPALIAYYPGIFSYDIRPISDQALGLEPYSNLQPLLFTLLWKLFIDIGLLTNINPITLYDIFQMLLLSYAATRLIQYFINKKVNKVFVIITLIFFVINPIISIFSLIPIKDVVNAAIILLLAINTLEYLDNKSYKKLIVIGIEVLISCLLRHNMFYSFILALIVVLVITRLKYKKLLIVTTVSLLFCTLINGPIFDILKIKKTNSAESICVPLQQLSTVINIRWDKLTPEENDRLKEFIPIEKTTMFYNPRFADPIKWYFNVDAYNANPDNFWYIWKRLAKKFPLDYIDSFLSLNMTYWYQLSDTIDRYAKRDYIEDGADTSIKIGDFSFEQVNNNTPIYNFYHSVANFDFGKDNFILSRIFSLSAPIWVLLMCFSILIAKKDINSVIVLLPSLMMWVTLIAGPVSIMRYIFPLFFMYPLYIGLCLKEK